MRPARAKVFGLFELASKQTFATITIDRDAGLFSVRPLRKRRQYTLPLVTVAEIVVRKILSAEVAEKKLAKRKKRR